MEYRLYFFVPYNISDIQKGIQAGHAALEYAREFGNTQEYVQFIENNKTWIILNGGTTRDFENGVDNGGDINIINVDLAFKDIPHSKFREPDLNNALSAICFLADERVWDKEKYPDFRNFLPDLEKIMFGFYLNDNPSLTLEEKYPEKYKEWLKFVGGEKNVFLRELLKDKHLA